MHEGAWWNLYVSITNQENEKKEAMNKMIESLLPWMNIELWQELEKKKKQGDFERENVAFEEQLRAMLGEGFSLDTLEVSDFDGNDVQPGGSIKDNLLG
jgi:hypothetical protein